MRTAPCVRAGGADDVGMIWSPLQWSASRNVIDALRDVIAASRDVIDGSPNHRDLDCANSNRLKPDRMSFISRAASREIGSA